MSSQKSPLLTTAVVTLGLITATATAAALVYTNRKRSSDTTAAGADRQRSAMDNDEVGRDRGDQPIHNS